MLLPSPSAVGTSPAASPVPAPEDRMRRVAAAVLSTALLVATACASSGSAGGGGSRLESAASPRHVAPVVLATRSMIPRATLDIDPSLSLYDVVGRYWPQVLRPSMQETFAPDPRGDIVGVYIDGNFAGGQEALRGIRASAVASIRRLTRSEEYVKWGKSHAGGALDISFRY
jgi:hypothetical protein